MLYAWRKILSTPQPKRCVYIYWTQVAIGKNFRPSLGNLRTEYVRIFSILYNSKHYAGLNSHEYPEQSTDCICFSIGHSYIEE